MSRRHLNLFLAAAVALAPSLSGAAPAAAAPVPQTSDAGGVTVTARPVDLTAGAPAWRFEVNLNTHTVALSDDLARTATLVDAAGKQHAALGWDGDRAGGHHRKGTVSFQPLEPRPDVLELRIQRPGEAAPRSFRWKLP